MKEFIKEVESIFHRQLEHCKDHIEGIGKNFKEIFPKVTENPLEAPMELNEVWSMDFMADVLSGGRKTRVFNVMDDCNREALAMEVGLNYPAIKVRGDLIATEGRDRPAKDHMLRQRSGVHIEDPIKMVQGQTGGAPVHPARQTHAKRIYGTPEQVL